MSAGLGLGIAEWLGKSALMTSPAGGFIRAAGGLFKKIPWQVWAAIAVVIALWIGVKWHAHEVHKTYQAGYQQAVADIKAKEAKLVAPLETAKQVADAKIDVGTEGVRKNAQDQNHRVDVNIADLLSMYTPAGGGSGHAVDGVHQANVGTGAQPADARADDGRAPQDSSGAEAGGAEPTITVPAKWLITRAGVCDRDYIAVKAWEQGYAVYYAAYTEWLAKTQKAAASTH